MNRLALFALALLALSMTSCFPSRWTMMKSVDEIARAPAGMGRRELTSRFLRTIEKPNGINAAHHAREGLAALAETLRETEDVGILEAVDAAHGGAYFEFMLCEFYLRAVDTRSAGSRYNAASEAITRREAQTWPHGRVTQRLLGQDTAPLDSP